MMIDITAKWPAVRIIGPKVSEENALEFIRRTDSALIDPTYACNNWGFNEALARLIGMPNRDTTDIQTICRWQEAFRYKFGHVNLEHLNSKWVASSYIFGPHGPVHPDGTVSYAANYGKYPHREEIEDDLGKIVVEFPWLSFDLYLWDKELSDFGGPTEQPDLGWHVDDKGIRRLTEFNVNLDELPLEGRITEAVDRISNGVSRETTWSIEQIIQMWSEQIAEAREFAKQEAMK